MHNPTLVAHELPILAEPQHPVRAEGRHHRLGEAKVLHRCDNFTVLDQEQPVAGQAGDDLGLRVEDAVVPEVGDEQATVHRGDELLQ